MEPLVSVVVPTFNRRASLARLLTALGEQSYAPTQFEVIVVDDGSTDRTVEAIQELSLPYTVRIVPQQHQGPAAARNLGVEHARGALIVFLDDDVIPLPDLLTTHVATHRTNQNAVVIGPMSPLQSWPRPAWIRWEEQQLASQYADMLAGKWACSPRQFYTGNASLSRARFLAAGGFDARFQRAEDVEFAYRLRDQGARFLFEPRADVWHLPSRSFEAWCGTPYQYGRYDVIMHRDKGHEALPAVVAEFQGRNPLNRLLARLCVGRRPCVDCAVGLLRRVVEAAEARGAHRVAALALSGIFNLLYWQGVAEELGGAPRVWQMIASSGRSARESTGASVPRADRGGYAKPKRT